jgi:hypothetical protein
VVLLPCADEADQRQRASLDDQIGVRRDGLVHRLQQLQGLAAVVGADLEAGEVDDGFEHVPGLEDGERGVDRAVDVDVLPAQDAGQVSQAAVAGQQRGLVQGMCSFGEAVRSRLPGSVGDLGDLSNPLG